VQLIAFNIKSLSDKNRQGGLKTVYIEQ